MFETILGLILIYAYTHLTILIFSKLWKVSTIYERVITIIGFAGIALSIIGLVTK